MENDRINLLINSLRVSWGSESSPMVVPFPPQALQNASQIRALDNEALEKATLRKEQIDALLMQTHREITGILLEATQAILDNASIRPEVRKRLHWLVKELSNLVFYDAGNLQASIARIMENCSGEEGEEEQLQRNFRQIEDQMRPLLVLATVDERQERQW